MIHARLISLDGKEVIHTCFIVKPAVGELLAIGSRQHAERLMYRVIDVHHEVRADWLATTVLPPHALVVLVEAVDGDHDSRYELEAVG